MAPDGPVMPATFPTLRDVALARARQLLEDDDLPDSPVGNPYQRRWVHSLALVQACTELAADLHRMADTAAAEALAGGASYAAIGAARGISRQAARKWHQKRQIEQEARRAAFRARRRDLDDDYYIDDADKEERWPPRPWRFRAPAGQWTVTLIGGPLDSQTLRVPVGDDAYPFVDLTDVFGRRHPRHARYSPTRPGDNEYVFTGEFFIRYS